MLDFDILVKDQMSETTFVKAIRIYRTKRIEDIRRLTYSKFHSVYKKKQPSNEEQI